MKNQWKAGDLAAIRISSVDYQNRTFRVKRINGVEHSYYCDVLQPLPTPDSITELERAVVKAAVKWRENHSAPFISDGPTADLYAAVLALRAARTPTDPVEELRDAWDGLCNHMSGTETAKQQIDRVSRAIAALEAARKVKP